MRFSSSAHKIKDVTTYVDYRGKTPSKSKSGVFLVTAKNVQKGYIDYSLSKEYIPESNLNAVMSRGRPQIGDVIITTEAPLGNVAQLDREDIAIAQRIIKYRGKKGILNNEYLMYYLLSSIFQKELNASSTGSTVKGIKGSRLHNMKILIPQIDEQIHIANLLRKWDQAPKKLNELIAAKKTFRKALMNRLLTGKIRFPGFGKPVLKAGDLPEGWRRARLTDLANVIVSNVDKKSDSSESEVLLCNYLDVYRNPYIDNSIDFMKATASNDEIRKFKVREGDILITKDSETPDDIGIPAIIVEDLSNVICGYHLAIIRCNTDGIDSLFLFMSLNSVFVKRQWKQLANGATRFGLAISDIGKVSMVVPCLEEQNAIADLLRFLDKEITNLSATKHILLQQKQGLLDRMFDQGTTTNGGING